MCLTSGSAANHFRLYAPLESVKVVVAVPEMDPVAVALYKATNEAGSVNEVEIVPLLSAVTSTE